MVFGTPLFFYGSVKEHDWESDSEDEFSPIFHAAYKFKKVEYCMRK
jgi:hypothetical protein